MNAKKITLICLTLAIFSCNDDNQFTSDNNSSENSMAERSQTEEELLTKGWKLVDVLKSESDSDTQEKSLKSEDNVKVFDLNSDHLKDLGFDINSYFGKIELKKAFAYGAFSADGIWFNKNLNVDANFSNNTGPEPSAKIVMEAPEIDDRENVDLPDDVYTTKVTNKQNTQGDFTVKYTYKDGHKTTWQRKIMGSFKLGTKAAVKIPLFGKGEVTTEVMVGGEITDGKEDFHEITRESNYSLKVPARSEVTVKVFTKIKSYTVGYSIPYTMFGFVRTNYSVPVMGHYFWSKDIRSYKDFINNISKEIGKIKMVQYVETHIIVSEAKNID